VIDRRRLCLHTHYHFPANVDGEILDHCAGIDMRSSGVGPSRVDLGG
jgi:hypothetical protein